MNRAPLGLIVPVSLLFSLGLLMVFNTTAAEIIDRSLDVSVYSALFKQIVYGAIGVMTGLIVYHIGYRDLLKNSWPLLVATTILLLLVFIPGIGQTINGARRWIGFAGYTFQPSECAKLLIPFCFIRWALMQQGTIAFWSFFKMLLLLAVPIILILIEPDNGTTFILAVSMAAIFWLTRIRWVYWVLPFAILTIGAVLVASRMPHVPDRIRVYLNPELDLLGKGHQPHQAKIAAGSGMLTGRGLGESLQKLNYLPEARSDYIAAIFAEECGFLGVLGLIVLYMTLTCSGLVIAFCCKERDGFLLASFLTFLISFQAFLNLGIVSGLLPSKGMTLPFFSQGGSSLIMNIVALFLLLDVARKNAPAKSSV